MPRPVTCPHCGEELDIPAEFRGREVRCAVCRATFVPPADGPDEPALPPARRARPDPARDRADDPYRDRWDDSRPRRRKRGNLTWLWLLLFGTFGCGGLGCCGFVVWAVSIDYPDFEPYDSREGRFHAEFPGTPTAAKQTVEDGRPRQGVEFHRAFPPETYFVYYVDLKDEPKGEKAVDAALDGACDRMARQTPGGKEMSRTTAMHEGHEARDLHIQLPGNTATFARFVLVGPRLYTIGITGGGLHPASQRWNHFRDSFQVTAAAAAKK